MSSRRQYITTAYLSDYLSGLSLNADYANADDLISQAEEMIDSYVGNQTKWFRISSSTNAGIYTPPDWEPDIPINRELRGRVASVPSSTQFVLQLYQQSAYQEDFFVGCWVEIIGGTGLNQTNQVSGSILNGTITVVAAWSTALDTTSVYRIYQLGKFPRAQDVYFDSLNQPVRYYKTIPDAVRRATAAQAAYINRMGRAFFESDSAHMQSEKLASYSYTRNSKVNPRSLFIAPEAKQALREDNITSRRGQVIV